MTIQYLTDRMSIEQLEKSHPELLEFLAVEYPRSVAGKEKVHFCGVLCSGKEESFVFLPRGASTNEKGGVAMLVMRSLARYSSEIESRSGNAPEQGDETSLAATIYNISADYMKYGLYAQRLRMRSLNSGKPDWKRTLQRQVPMINLSRTPVYTLLDSSRFLSAPENMLAVIQAETLRDIIAKHGWWVGLDRSNLSDLSNVPAPAIPKSRFASEMDRFKVRLFDDRSLQLAGLLKQYWSTSATQAQGSFMCGVSDFHAVWEHMLKKTVSDVSKKWNARLPLPSYTERDNSLAAKDGGIIDIVVENSKNILVADAKYYGAQSAGQAPGFADILKQSFYSKAIRELNSEKHVRSIFVFPAWKDNAPLVKAGFYSRETKEPIGWLNDVDCIYVDIRSLMDSYVRKGAIDWYASAESY